MTLRCVSHEPPLCYAPTRARHSDVAWPMSGHPAVSPVELGLPSLVGAVEVREDHALRDNKTRSLLKLQIT